MLIVHFDENMLIGDAADLDAFMEMYGVEAISKEYLQLLGKRKFEFCGGCYAIYRGTEYSEKDNRVH